MTEPASGTGAQDAPQDASMTAEFTRDLLIAAIETLADGFVLYDADERLVLCNERYQEIYAESAPAIVPGATFEEILRYGLERGQYADAVGQEETWLAERLAHHRQAGRTVEQQLSSGRWLRIVERATPDGGRVGLRIDITEQVASRERAELAERRLREAVNATPLTFWLYDANDRLVMFNDSFKRMFSRCAPAIAEGVRYNDIIRYGARAGQFMEAIGREEEFIASAIARRERTRRYDWTYQLGCGRWVKAYNVPTSDGGSVGFVTDVTTLKTQEIALTRAAQTDPLTGLLNRRGLADRLAEITDRTPHGVLHIDLDKFKPINDMLGHDAGDHVLRACAERLTEETAEGDIVARVGGDEFAVVSPRCADESCVRKLAEAILARMTEPVIYRDKAAHVGASIGMALWDPAEEPEAETALLNADIALKSAKETGRRRAVFFRRRMRRTAEREARMANEIAAGLGRGEFEVWLQPQIALASGATLGFEALARWRHPDRGLIAAEAFLPVAQEANLGDRIDAIILDLACAAAARIREEVGRAPRISINLAPSRLAAPTLPDDICAALDRYRLAPDRLVIEILESTLLDERANHLEEAVARLKAEGLLIELDDFGTGHAALTSLRRFDLDRVKIDRSLIGGLDRDDELQKITGTILQLCDGLGIDTICEGVETEGELDTLKRLGCRAVQGFVFAMPMPVDEAADWIATAPLLEEAPSTGQS